MLMTGKNKLYAPVGKESCCCVVESYDKIMAEKDAYSLREKKSLAAKLLKKGEDEKALAIYQELAGNGDYEAAVRVMKLCLKRKDAEAFERYRSLAIQLLEKDQTIGKWSKTDKMNKLRAMQPPCASSIK